MGQHRPRSSMSQIQTLRVALGCLFLVVPTSLMAQVQPQTSTQAPGISE